MERLPKTNRLQSKSRAQNITQAFAWVLVPVSESSWQKGMCLCRVQTQKWGRQSPCSACCSHSCNLARDFFSPLFFLFPSFSPLSPLPLPFLLLSLLPFPLPLFLFLIFLFILRQKGADDIIHQDCTSEQLQNLVNSRSAKLYFRHSALHLALFGAKLGRILDKVCISTASFSADDRECAAWWNCVSALTESNWQRKQALVMQNPCL